MRNKHQIKQKHNILNHLIKQNILNKDNNITNHNNNTNTNHNNNNKSTQLKSAQPKQLIVFISLQIQDIRLLTLFFHKWCKFISYTKSIKRLRLKQIDDLRKSLTFNMYAVKFSYFHNWRKIIKRQKQNKEKFNIIENNKNKNILKNVMKGIYQHYEIKEIQEMLKRKVEDVMKIERKHMVIKKLGVNKQRQQRKVVKLQDKKVLLKPRYLQKIRIQHLFLSYLLQLHPISPIKTKTLLSNSFQHKQTQKICLLKISFKQLLQQVKFKKQNQQKVKEIIKIQTLNSLNNWMKKMKIMEELESEVEEEMKNSAIRRCINRLKQNRRIREEFQYADKNIIQKQNKQGQSINPMNQQQYLYKTIKFQHQSHLLNQYVIKNSIKKAFTKLSFHFQYHKTQKQNQSLIDRQLQKSFISSLSINHSRILKSKSKLSHYLSIYCHNLLKKCLKSMIIFHKITLSQQQTLQQIQQQIINRHKLKYSFYKILYQSNKLLSTQKLYKKLQNFTIKFVFNKCFSKQIKIIKGINKKVQKCKENQLRLLFNMLIKNKQIMNNNIQEVKQIAIRKVYQQKFISQIKSQYDYKRSRQLLSHTKKQSYKANIINNLIQKQKHKQQFNSKYYKLQKYLAFQIIQDKFQLYTKTQSQYNHKISQVQSTICKINMMKINYNIKNKFIKNQQIQNKCKQVKKYQKKNRLFTMLNNTQLFYRHSKHVIQQKISQLKNILQKSFIQKFIFTTKQAYLQRWVDWNQKLNVITLIKSQYNEKIKQNTLQNYLSFNKLQSSFSIILQNSQAQTQLLMLKSSQLQSIFLNNRIKYLKNITKKHKIIKQTSQLSLSLKTKLKTKYFSKFMRDTLVMKYQKVQEFCSVKTYAKNLKNKAFKGLKIMLLRLRDKENRFKTEQQIIVKVDKALHHSRHTNKMTETIHRYNMRQSNNNNHHHQYCIPR